VGAKVKDTTTKNHKGAQNHLGKKVKDMLKKSGTSQHSEQTSVD
jgi:hypothetical protein